MNKAKRLIENMDEKVADRVRSKIGDIDEKATPRKQARYVNEVLNTVAEENVCMVDTMRNCGACCISANAVKIAKKLYAKSNSIEEFFVLLNEADIGGQNLHIVNGKIIAIYKKCYCNLPKKIDNMNPVYCECSAGWYKKLFSEVFEREVKVQIIDTILNGARECVFEITNFC